MQSGSTAVEDRGDRLMTIGDVVTHTRYSERTIRRAIAAGEISVVRYGRSVRVRARDLSGFVERHVDAGGATSPDDSDRR